MAFEQIRCLREGAVATITLDRPDKLNAFTFSMLDEINAALDSVCDAELRALVITGAGRAFSAGDDLAGMGGSDLPEDIRRGHHRIVQRLQALSLPVVAALNGYALGAAFDLALACDFRIASERAELGDMRVKRSMCSMSGASFWLPRMIGLARATEILLLGERIPAARALEIGLVNRVVPDAEFEGAVAEFVERLLALPTVAVGWQKKCVRFGLDNDLPTALEHELAGLLSSVACEDWREAIHAFLEKREPRFRGR